jgi:3-deoxy-D-manno-octulosonate 8-phosphate phosphatase (KDO 8-P phosphatase)
MSTRANEHMEYLEKLKDITTFVLDLDGVLTNGTVLVTESGEQLRSMNIKDGYALQLAIKKGYNVVVISGGKSETVIKRFTGLGVNDVFLGISNKLETLKDYLSKKRINSSEVLFMGDDIPDIELMNYCGLATCPYDAVEEIREKAHYISGKKGGEGCVRDVIEKVMKIRGNWLTSESTTTPSV